MRTLKSRYTALMTIICVAIGWAAWIFSVRLITPLFLPLVPGFLQQMTIGITGTLVALAIITWVRKWYGGMAYRVAASPRNNALFFALGTAAGAVIIVLMVVAMAVFSPMELVPVNSSVGLETVLVFLGLIPLALMEELAFRASAFNLLRERLGILPAQVVVATGFALYHVTDRHGFAAAFLGPFIWSFVFGMAAVWSRGIAFPTGIHAALNAGQLFFGMKGGAGIRWSLALPPNASADTITKATQTGIVLQLCVLLAALGLTLYASRKATRGGL